MMDKQFSHCLAQEKNFVESASLFFWLKHLHRFSYIKLELIGILVSLFFILVWNFSIYLWAFLFDGTFFILLLHL